MEVVGNQAPKPKKKKIRSQHQVSVNLSNCKYDVVREVIKKKGWQEVGDECEWQLYWTDTSVGIERLLRMKPTQKINHFTGMLEICRKKSLCRNIANMQRRFAEDYNFMPKSFLLPEQLDEFVTHMNSKNKKGKKTTFIVKPDNGCQGKGIRLLQKSNDIYNAMTLWDTTNAVVQQYIHKPLLINGLKFDLRVYALVTCCDPLRIFLYQEGLVRFCTEKYQAPSKENLSISCMHLTNYAVNKHNTNFNSETSNVDSLEGSKWSLKSLSEWMNANGFDYSKVWNDIGDMIVKTVISAQPTLAYSYSSAFPTDNDGFSCFEILGLDIMLDHKAKPWLIEINHSPSFNTDTDLDMTVKEGLITDCVNLIQLSAGRLRKARAAEKKASKERLYSSRPHTPGAKRDRLTSKEDALKRRAPVKINENYENRHKGLFTRIFPSEDETKQASFDRFQEGSSNNFKESFHFKVASTLQNIKASVAEKNAAKEANLQKKGNKATAAKLKRKLRALSAHRDANALETRVAREMREFRQNAKEQAQREMQKNENLEPTHSVPEVLTDYHAMPPPPRPTTRNILETLNTIKEMRKTRAFNGMGMDGSDRMGYSMGSLSQSLKACYITDHITEIGRKKSTSNFPVFKDIPFYPRVSNSRDGRPSSSQGYERDRGTTDILYTHHVSNGSHGSGSHRGDLSHMDAGRDGMLPSHMGQKLNGGVAGQPILSINGSRIS